MPDEKNPYRDLPAVDELAAAIAGDDLARPQIVAIARTAVERARANIENGSPGDARSIAEDLVAEALLARSQRVINATGVLLHTNLGRAPISASAGEAARESAVGFSNVELNLADGSRGGRGVHTTSLLSALTGAEDAVVVNNNAAALLLALAATSSGRAVPVARGELIEIGGSYRIPEVMEVSGARLIEVGTTNRTRVSDYETALQIHDCGAVLKVHPSNYRVEGFTEEANVIELAEVAHRRDVPLIHDIGSGLLDEHATWLGPSLPEWLKAEPSVRQSLDNGADLVTFSGDKLLGGPQAGIIVGSRDAVAALRRHPLARALRTDGMTQAALAATLEAYADDRAMDIPFWRMAALEEADLRPRIDKLKAALGGESRPGVSLIGAGSVPGTGIPTPQLVLAGEDHLYERLLRSSTPVAARRAEGDLVVDLRAVEPADDKVVIEMVSRCR